MFNNLIESTSHAKEFKRRGSFLLFTTATYVVLFVVTGVISIYAYDAHLESQSTEWEVTIMPLIPQPPAPEAVRNTIREAPNTNNSVTHSTRVALIDSASNPNKIPEHVGTVAQPVPPARPDSVIGNQNLDPPTIGSTRGVPGGTGTTPHVEISDPPPPPPAQNPKPAPQLVRVSQTVLVSKAISLPRPVYPPMAKQIRLQGSVNVQVFIDETGKVISAKAISGHPLLVPEAQKAATQARFSPTMIGDTPVKVSGVITYNFVLGN
ncbi:MAG TPA: energy transducer TonB [Pyrinomonadaceae bacterium]|nr:energy transducer TonB [Pyrinomonadaceae bacterium]